MKKEDKKYLTDDEAESLKAVCSDADSTSPGCLCEGWGAADATTATSGYADISVDGIVNMKLISFTNTSSTATSIVEIPNGEGIPILRVTHFYHPTPLTKNLYQADVSVMNIGSTPVDLRYRRVMDWDIEPTAFNEFVTIDTGTSPSLVFTSDDGFASANPLSGPSDLGFTGSFVDAGPDDHGALFDFNFGTLASGATQEFKIFYGAAATEAEANAAIAGVGAEAYSLGQPNIPDGPTLGTPNTFIFAFAGVGGTPLPLTGLLWETNISVDLPPKGSSVPASVDISSDLNNATGRLMLVAMLYSNSSQILSSSNTTFYVFDTNTTIALETDKEAYRPGERVIISGEIKNWASIPASNLTFVLDAAGNELLRETFNLDVNETRSFSSTYSSNSSFMVIASIGSIAISQPVEIEAPSLNVNVTAPNVAGRKEFNVTTMLENKGRLDIDETLDVEGNIYNVNIPGGETRLIGTPFVINQNKTVNISLRGDVDLDISKFVVFGENASLKVLPEKVYTPGLIDVPYNIVNMGILETEFTATFALGDKIIEKSIYLPPNSNFSGVLFSIFPRVAIL